jgi:hypothetical protein
MVCFQTKNPSLGKFWGIILLYFITIWSILQQLEIFYGPLVHFVVIWYIIPRFGILYQEKIWYPGVFQYDSHYYKIRTPENIETLESETKNCGISQPIQGHKIIVRKC